MGFHLAQSFSAQRLKRHLLKHGTESEESTDTEARQQQSFITADGDEQTQQQQLLYPALLLQFAVAFRQHMTPLLSDQLRGERTYRGAFAGSDAVDQILTLIGTSDRNLALLLGRSLDAQGYVRDVICGHRLRDNPDELYEFAAGALALGGEIVKDEEAKEAPNGLSGTEDTFGEALPAGGGDGGASETSTLVSEEIWKIITRTISQAEYGLCSPTATLRRARRPVFATVSHAQRDCRS